MNAALTIRPLEPRDAAALHAFAMAPAVRRFTLRLASERLVDFEKRLENPTPNFHSFVATWDGTPVGMAGLIVFAKPAMAHGGQLWIEVDPAYHRRGIGRALIATLLDLADRELGLRRVELHAHATNAGALALYEAMGFEREGVLRGNILVEGEYLDSVAMARLRPSR